MSGRIDSFPFAPIYQTNFGGGLHTVHDGAELRDYFAAAALHGFLSSKTLATRFDPNDDAAYCYRIADAMIAAREKTP